MKHWTTKLATVLACCLFLSICISTPVSASPRDRKSNTMPWWKTAVIYEIYPRSFKDSDANGTGDLRGIIEKLDYLQNLGIDAIWLTPCYPSPQVDFGYDISDYCAIDPLYGTLADYDQLVREARKRGIRIVMDLVLNHTSDRHRWFEESRASRDNPKRDWYIWKPLKEDGSPPSNWVALFGGSAWTKDEKTGESYYHFFYPEQPDLNWRNPEVKKAMHDVARFWLDRGTAGFRLDAINTLFEDEKLTNNPLKPGKNAYGDPDMEHKYNYLLLPEIHKELKDLRKVLGSYNDHRLLLGETTAEDLDQLVSMYGDGGGDGDEIQLPMNFRFAYINELSAPKFRKSIAEIDENARGGWPCYVLSNHDARRHFERYGDGRNNDQIARLMGALLLTLRGTPVLYYGEELGMQNRDPETKEEVKDPIGLLGWPEEKGRDGERTPMQWNATENAGFSTVRPWLPVSNNYKSHNVETESKKPGSILNFYNDLIKLRKENSALKEGEYIALARDQEHVLAYARKSQDRTVIVALNMSAAGQTLSLPPEVFKAGRQARVLLASPEQESASVDLEKMSLAPYAVLIAELEGTR